MIRYVLKRLLFMIPTILLTSLIIFFAMKIAGGDPVKQILPENATVEQQENLREEMGLNDPLVVQYARYMAGLITGDMGESYVTGKDVLQTFMERLPMTLALGGSALIVACIISVPLGIYTALNQNTWKDTTGMVFALFGVSMPNFWLGLMLMLLFAVKWKLLPSQGAEGPEYLVLPALTVGLGLAALITRTTRSAMLDVIRQDYMTTAKAKGASRRRADRALFGPGLGGGGGGRDKAPVSGALPYRRAGPAGYGRFLPGEPGPHILGDPGQAAPGGVRQHRHPG